MDTISRKNILIAEIFLMFGFVLSLFTDYFYVTMFFLGLSFLIAGYELFKYLKLSYLTKKNK